MMKMNDVLLRNVMKVVVFIIFLFLFYLFFVGYYNFGGGFVVGFIMVGVIILMLFVYDIKMVVSMFNINMIMFIGVGFVFVFGIGMIGIFIGDFFLMYKFGYVDLFILGDIVLYMVILFDFGVYLVVVGVIFMII